MEEDAADEAHVYGFQSRSKRQIRIVMLKKNPLSFSLAAGPFGSGCRFPAVRQLSFCLLIKSAAFKQGSTMAEPPMRPLWRPLGSRGCAFTLCHAERRLREHRSNRKSAVLWAMAKRSPDHSAHRLKYAVALGPPPPPHQAERRISSPGSIRHLICSPGLYLLVIPLILTSLSLWEK